MKPSAKAPPEPRLPHGRLVDGTRWHFDPVMVCGVLYVIKFHAKRAGYAVAVHGSLARDLDLVAVPWAETAVAPEELVRRLMEAIGGEYTLGQQNPAIKPHGRLAYAINLHPTGMYVDLSVMPPVAP